MFYWQMEIDIEAFSIAKCHWKKKMIFNISCHTTNDELSD